jgi:hypothetical protein
MIGHWSVLGALGIWAVVWGSACMSTPQPVPQKVAAVASSPTPKAPQPEAKSAEPKAPAPKTVAAKAPEPKPAPPKPKLKPGASDLHVVYAAGDQLMRIDLQTGETAALGVDKVVAATQDGEGHWWVVQAQGKKHVLLRIPSSFELSEVKVVVADLPGDSGYFDVEFSKDNEFRMVALAPLREATKQCGGMSGPNLCDHAMGWTDYDSWTWAPTPAQLKALGLAAPKPAKRSKVTEARLRRPFSRKHCRCWGEDYRACGSTTPLGTSGWTLMLTQVDCGDMVHPACMLRSADKRRYSAFSQEEFTTDLRWRRRPGRVGSCGPFYMTPSGDWISDGKGIFCTLGKGTVCTAPIKGDYLGTVGEALLRIELR